MTIEPLASHEWLTLVEYLSNNGIGYMHDYRDVRVNDRIHRLVILTPVTPEKVLGMADAINAIRAEYREMGLRETTEPDKRRECRDLIQRELDRAAEDDSD